MPIRRWFKRKKPLVRDAVEEHMGGPCETCETMTHTIRPIERINLHRALERMLGESGRLIGYGTASYSNVTISELILDDKPIAPVQRQRFETKPDEFLDCVTRGIYMLRHDGKPIVALLSLPESSYDSPALEVMARERITTGAVLEALHQELKRELVYKGRTIFLEEDRAGQIHVRFQLVRPTTRESLIFPEELLIVVERNVLGMVRHGETLRRAGRSTRQGLLFHGPPGTGKTLMLRYLGSVLPDHTVIVLTGREQALVRESCQVARQLAPSMVLFEDVDLIAKDRENNSCPALLHDLMNEMDGLGPKAEVIFVLTTNRPETLEAALTARPGRIDQAIEFPLPDEDCRRRLFMLYGNGLSLANVDLGRWIERTRGVSPAFIEELLRKSTLMAAERGERSDPLELSDEDVSRAMEELVVFGGELTQKLLGFHTFGFGHGKG